MAEEIKPNLISSENIVNVKAMKGHCGHCSQLEMIRGQMFLENSCAFFLAMDLESQ